MNEILNKENELAPKLVLRDYDVDEIKDISRYAFIYMHALSYEWGPPAYVPIFAQFRDDKGLVFLVQKDIFNKYSLFDDELEAYIYKKVVEMVKRYQANGYHFLPYEKASYSFYGKARKIYSCTAVTIEDAYERESYKTWHKLWVKNQLEGVEIEWQHIQKEN